MIETVYYIHLKGVRSGYDLFLTNAQFVMMLMYTFFVPFFYILYQLDYHNILNWFEFFDRAPLTRMAIIPLIIVSVFCYFNYFREKKRVHILAKYEGRYQTLIKYSFIIYLLLIFAPLLLTFLLLNIFLNFYN